MKQATLFFSLCTVFTAGACSGESRPVGESQGGYQTISVGGSETATTTDSVGGVSSTAGGQPSSVLASSQGGETTNGTGGSVATSTGGQANATGGTTGTKPSTATGGCSYLPCECDPYVSADALAAFDKGDAGAGDALYEAWSTADHKDAVKGTLQTWHSTPFLSSAPYLAPIDETTTATILPVDQAERNVRLTAVLCAETQNITGAPDPYQTFYFLDGTSVGGHVYNDDYLYVVGPTTSVSVFAPYGLSGGVPLRVCFRRLGDSEI